MLDLIEKAGAAYVKAAIAQDQAKRLTQDADVLFLQVGRRVVSQLNVNCCIRSQGSARMLRRLGRAMCDAQATD